MRSITLLVTPILMLAMTGILANSTYPQNSIQWHGNSLNNQGAAQEQSDAAAVEGSVLYGKQVSYRSHSHYFSYDRHQYRERIRTKFPRRIIPQGERVFFFSPRLKAWAAYDANGKRVGYGRANGGSSWCSDVGRPCLTPRGEFRVRSKGSPDCKSSKFPLPNGGAPMPYCMFFLGGYAIHGSPTISNSNSSHGCIRVYNEAAYWLSKYFIKTGTRVVVMSY